MSIQVTRHENIWQIETNLRDRQRFHSCCGIITYRMTSLLKWNVLILIYKDVPFRWRWCFKIYVERCIHSNVLDRKVVSQMSSTVFKSSQWNLLHIVPMNRRCLWHMFCVAKSQDFQSYVHLKNIYIYIYIHIEKVCVSNFFHIFQVIQIKIATLKPYVVLMFMTCIEAWARCSRVMSLF